MKKIKNIFVVLLLVIFTVSNSNAQWIPDEPMVIYGKISGTNANKLEIFDWNNHKIKEIKIQDNKFWTNKTFDLDKKILLEKFSWNLKFKIDWKLAIIKKTNCWTTFKKWWICNYEIYIKHTSNNTNQVRHTNNTQHTSSNTNQQRHTNNTQQHTSSNTNQQRHTNNTQQHTSSNTNQQRHTNNTQQHTSSNTNQQRHTNNTQQHTSSNTNQQRHTNNTQQHTSNNTDQQRKNTTSNVIINKSILKKVKLINWNTKYNKIILKFAQKIDKSFINNENKELIYSNLNKITELKQKKLSKKQYIRQLKPIVKKIKLIIIKERILKKLKKKTKKQVIENKNTRKISSNEERIKKLREIRKRILSRLKNKNK